MIQYRITVDVIQQLPTARCAYGLDLNQLDATFLQPIMDLQYIERRELNMTNAYSLAKEHLDKCLQEATKNNVDLNTYGQALIWMLIDRYQEAGRSNSDIISEIQYTLENIDDDGTFHVSRNRFLKVRNRRYTFFTNSSRRNFSWI